MERKEGIIGRLILYIGVGVAIVEVGIPLGKIIIEEIITGLKNIF